MVGCVRSLDGKGKLGSKGLDGEKSKENQAARGPCGRGRGGPGSMGVRSLDSEQFNSVQ